MKRYFIFVILALLMILSGQAYAHGKPERTTEGDLAISVNFDKEGRLWRVQVNKGFVEVSQSLDLGKTFSKPLRVNYEAQQISAHGELRPNIAIGKNGEIYVTWMQNLKARFSGYVWFARSLDRGKSFEKPIIVHQDRTEIGHAFEELVVSPNGDITILWLDARDLVAVKQAGKAHQGSSIYYTVSTDQGKTFLPEKKLVDNSCECCRIATTIKPDGTVVAMWRHVFAGSERDHAITEVNAYKAATIVRASYGRWKLDGCPHHGGALAVGEGFGYHMAYFDGAGDKPSLMYARMDGEAWVSSPPKRFGNMKNSAGHPAIYSRDDKVWLVWREMGAKTTEIHGMMSEDGGRSWSEAVLIFSTKGKADYPQLIEHKEKIYLAINTVTKGFKLLPLVE